MSEESEVSAKVLNEENRYKKATYTRTFIIITKKICVLAASVGMMSAAYSNPSLNSVTSGNVSVTQSSSVTTVQQKSEQAIIEWNSFNIGAHEKTQFIQPNANAIALNRINPSQGPSQIFGALTATGKLILVNQAGIFFGAGSHVDVGGIIATTSDISNSNFLSGHYRYKPGYVLLPPISQKSTTYSSTKP